MGLRTFHIIGSIGSGGAERFYLRLVRGLCRRGNPAAALCRPGGAVGKALLAEGAVEVLPVALRGSWDLPSRWRISRLVKEHGPALVQTYMGKATRLTRLGPRSGAVHVARLGGFYGLHAYRHADAWVGNTRAICDYLLENGFPRDRVFHIGNFVDLPVPASPEERERTREELGVPPGSLVVFALGRFSSKKGFTDLLSAFARLPAAVDGRPVLLVLAGGGHMEGELKAQALREGAGERVVWTGWRDDPAPLYEAADLFVCPSRHEPLGNVILEAWSHGRAVLSTDTHGARELVAPGRDGELVPPGDPGALLGGMERLLAAGAEARRQMGEEGRRKVADAYSPDRILDAYLDLYRRLAGGGAA
jgi:glycosyltransferase involved in cell wall biosynthesis